MVKKITRLLAVSFVLCFFLFLSASSFSVQAKSTKTTHTCYMHLEVSAPAAEKDWWTNNIWHIRNWDHAGYLYDGLDWTIFYLGNNNFDPVAWNGVGWGKIIFYGDSGTFEGTLVLKFSPGFIVAGKFTCQGTGAYEGMLIKGLWEGVFGIDPLVSIAILNTHA